MQDKGGCRLIGLLDVQDSGKGISIVEIAKRVHGTLHMLISCYTACLPDKIHPRPRLSTAHLVVLCTAMWWSTAVEDGCTQTAYMFYIQSARQVIMNRCPVVH